MPLYREPHIVIEGTVLTESQAMAVRVAVCSFESQVSESKYAKKLGPIAKLYQKRLREVLKIIMEEP